MKHIFTEKNISIFCVVIAILLPLFSAKSALKSDSYILEGDIDYQNYQVQTLGEDLDIKNLSSNSVDKETIRVTWETDVPANSSVIFDTDSDLSDGRELGNIMHTYTDHQVDISGLTPGEEYYYQAKSVTSQGTVGLSSKRTFVFPEKEEEEEEEPSRGGGVIIKDKQDKVPPRISEVETEEIKRTSAVITWQTNEDATGFVEYGTSTDYGKVAGNWESTTDHRVKLNNLNISSDYNFRVISSDSWGNLSRSENYNFSTLPREEPGEEPGEKEDEEQKEPSELSRNELLERLNVLQRMADSFPAPEISGNAEIKTRADGVTISWESNKAAKSRVAYSRDSAYNPGSENPYEAVVVSSEDNSTQHEAEIQGLEPNATYHYQIRMEPVLGPDYVSEDNTFKTTEEGLIIENYYTEKNEKEKRVTFRWVTNREATSEVQLIPYRGGELDMESAVSIKENEYSVIHRMESDKVESGVVYDVKIISTDRENNTAVKRINKFTLGEDKTPPAISMINTNSTLFVREDKAQTVVSWKTDEPATTQVYYELGFHESGQEWQNKTEAESSYGKKHTKVINNIETGEVYSFRVKSIDSSGNTASSQVHTFLTPEKEDSVFQMIIDIFKDLFGWAFQ